MISTILQYSTIDFRFLKANLDQVTKFSDEVIIPICDHFFNGEPENEDLLNASFEICKQYDNVHVYMFSWEGENTNSGYYHNLSRSLGTNVAKNEWLLFVDADEIISDRFDKWFDTIKHTDYSFWLTCYWYFREPIYQATKVEAAGLLIKKSKCQWNVNVLAERQQLFGTVDLIDGFRTPIHYDGEPLVHHFSWVRSKEEMLKKVQNWGHKNDKNWTELVEEEFSRPFNGSDFVHGYQYRIVDNKFNL